MKSPGCAAVVPSCGYDLLTRLIVYKIVAAANPPGAVTSTARFPPLGQQPGLDVAGQPGP